MSQAAWYPRRHGIPGGMVSPAPKDAPEWIASAVAGLAHQIGGPDAWGVPKCLLELKGSDLMGLPLSAPNATFERVYTLPLLTISMGKGTGVVTSVRGLRPPARPPGWLAAHHRPTDRKGLSSATRVAHGRCRRTRPTTTQR